MFKLFTTTYAQNIHTGKKFTLLDFFFVWTAGTFMSAIVAQNHGAGWGVAFASMMMYLFMVIMPTQEKDKTNFFYSEHWQEKANLMGGLFLIAWLVWLFITIIYSVFLS